MLSISKNTPMMNSRINEIARIAPEALVAYLNRILTMTKTMITAAAKINKYDNQVGIFDGIKGMGGRYGSRISASLLVSFGLMMTYFTPPCKVFAAQFWQAAG